MSKQNSFPITNHYLKQIQAVVKILHHNWTDSSAATYSSDPRRIVAMLESVCLFTQRQLGDLRSGLEDAGDVILELNAELSHLQQLYDASVADGDTLRSSVEARDIVIERQIDQLARMYRESVVAGVRDEISAHVEQGGACDN